MDKRSYVLIEPLNGSPKIKRYDSYLTPRDCLGGILEDYTDTHYQGQVFELRLTLFIWTEEEYQDYCAQNEIEDAP